MQKPYDTPMPSEIPANLPTGVREALERVYQHLRGATFTSSGSARNPQFRQVANDAGQLEVGVWRNRSFEPITHFDTNGDIRPGNGVVLLSPDGTAYRLVVADGGALSTVAL